MYDLRPTKAVRSYDTVSDLQHGSGADGSKDSSRDDRKKYE